MIRFQTSEFVCSTKLEIYLSPREVIFLFPSLTNRRDLKKTKNREVPRDLRRLSSPFIDVSLFVLFFFWRFCNFKTMTSNSCLRCDLKESWLWGRNGPSCGFISNSFFKCLLLDLSLSVLPPLLVLLWLLVCLHFSFPLFLDFLSPDFCCVCILDISSSLKLHFYCSICSLPWPLIKKKREISRNSTRGPRRAIMSVKYNFKSGGKQQRHVETPQTETWAWIPRIPSIWHSTLKNLCLTTERSISNGG